MFENTLIQQMFDFFVEISRLNVRAFVGLHAQRIPIFQSDKTELISAGLSFLIDTWLYFIFIVLVKFFFSYSTVLEIVDWP